MVFARRLRALRKAHGLSQRELAAVFGFAPSTIAMYESAQRSPDLGTLSRLAEFFAVSLDYLVRESPAPELPPELQAFLTRESSRPYLYLAKELADEGLEPDQVRELSRVIKQISGKR